MLIYDLDNSCKGIDFGSFCIFATNFNYDKIT